MAEPGATLERVLSAWLEWSGRADPGALAGLLATDVEWQGILPGYVCHGRDEVMALLGSRPRPPRLTRFDAEEIGDMVALRVAGPDFRGPDDRPPTAPRSLLFTFRGGTVARIESYAGADAAFERARREG